MPCCAKFDCKENDKNSYLEGPSNLFRFNNRTTYDYYLTVNVLIQTNFDSPQLLKTSQNIDVHSLPNISLDAPSTPSTVTLRIGQQPPSTASTNANQSPFEPEENHAAGGTHVVSAASARSTHPIVEEDFASVQNLHSYIKIRLQLSSFYSPLTIRPTNPQWGGTVHVFDGTYSAVALANAGFLVDSSGSITCSGCQNFHLLSVEAFRPSEHNSQRSLREWRSLIHDLSLDTRHGVNCKTRQLRHTHDSAAGRAAARSTPLEVTSGRSDSRATLVRSLQEPAERSEMPREAADGTRPAPAITNSSRPPYAEHHLVQSVKMLYLTSHNMEPLPNGNGRRPLTMQEAQGLIRVVDFNRDPPRDEREWEADTMKSAERRWESYMHVPQQIFRQTAAGCKLAFYLSLFGLFLSYRPESTRISSPAPSFQFVCSFCKCTTRLRISLENDPETVFCTLRILHNLRSPTCPRTLGSIADDGPFTSEQRIIHLRRIEALEEVAACSDSQCLTPPGLFRRVRMNEAAVLSVPNTTHFDASTERDCIRDALNLPELLGSCDVPTALTEDCEEYNMDLATDREPEQLLLNELDFLRDVNSPLYDMNDARLAKELNSETIANPAFYDPCTVLLGVARSASAELSNAVLRAETFDRRNLRVDVEPIAPWPRSHPSPRRMAAAGFYLAPTASRPDRVRCFHCGTERSGWSERDNPFVRHVQLSADCAYLLRMRGLQWVRSRRQPPDASPVRHVTGVPFSLSQNSCSGLRKVHALYCSMLRLRVILHTVHCECDAGAGAVDVAAAQQAFAENPAAQAMLSSSNTASAAASDVVYDQANEEVNAAGGYGTLFAHAQEIRWLNNHYQRIIQNERGMPTSK